MLDIGWIGGVEVCNLPGFARFGIVAVYLAAQFDNPDMALVVYRNIIGPYVFGEHFVGPLSTSHIGGDPPGRRSACPATGAA